MPRALKILLVNIAATVGLLLAVELASRLAAPTPMPQPLAAEGQEEWVTEREFHPQLFWRLTPRRDADGEIVINELGLRGPMPGPKAEGEWRILSLGESTTAAMRLPLEQTYTSVLEKELGGLTGRPVRAINAGTGGYTLAQGVSFLQLYGLDLEPDLVLTYFGFNDFVRASYRVERDAHPSVEARGLTDLELQRQRRKPLTRGLLWLQQHSNFARYASRRGAPTEIQRGGQRRVPAKDRLLLYRQLSALCEDRGIRLVVLVPMYRSFQRHEAFLRKLESNHGFEVLDLPARLGIELLERERLFFDPVHPRPELHRRIGEEIAAYLAGSATALTEADALPLPD